MRSSTFQRVTLATAVGVALAACGASDDSPAAEPEADTSIEVPEAEVAIVEPEADTSIVAPVVSSSTFEVEVWADNWMAVYVDGELVGEDSVPITTERSFNSETFTFDASMPFTLAIEAKDFTETASGLEYIGEPNQQMGDGGIIAQVIDVSTGEVVAVTDSDWTALMVNQAPLNPDCEGDPDPDATCESLIVDNPADWASADFDDSGWVNATEWSAADVSPKDGYDEIFWDASARLVWGGDLEIDNTILLRSTVS